MSHEHRNVPSLSQDSRESEDTMRSEPHVGLFYVVDGTLYWEGIPVVQAGGSPYFKLYPKKHSEYWRGILVRRMPELKKYGPDRFPRGRVVLDVKKDIYELMTDTCILENHALVKEIIQAMGLPESKVMATWDINCECPACNRDRWKAKSYKVFAVDEPFETTRDGRKAFFPWKAYGIFRSRFGYVIPSAKKSARLRKSYLRWVSLAAIGASIVLGLIEVVWDVTNSKGMVALMYAIFVAAFFISHYYWVRSKCRGLKRIEEE